VLGNKPVETWIAEYSRSHQHPINRVCHTLGIPMIAVSLPLFAYVEGKPPEFFHDWRFLLVGLRWWVAKLRGRA
jgi:hypothetical protein